MRTCARPNRINIDLGEFKAPWLKYCAQHQLTPSEAFRMIIAKLIANPAGAAGMSDLRGPSSVRRKIRKEVRLAPNEVARLETIAAREGYSLTRWMVALVRARLDRGAHFGQYELEALGKSNLHLLAIGRNLNQIARAVNAGNGEILPLLDPVLRELRSLIETHTGTVARLIEQNIEHWRTS